MVRLLRSSLIGLACACGDPDTTADSSSGGTTGGSQQGLAGSAGLGGLGQGSSGQGGSSGNPGTSCQLTERSEGPRVSLTGTVCGQSASFTTTAGQVIRLARRSLLEPIDEITTILVKDDPSDAAVDLPDYFEEFAFLFNVALAEGGPTRAVQSGDFDIETGLLAACGFGSLGFRAGTARVDIESVEGDVEGRLRLTVSDIPVLGFDPAYGKMELPSCDGSVSVTLEGPYSHDPG